MVTKLFAENAKFEIKRRALEHEHQDLEIEICQRLSLNQNLDLRAESKIFFKIPGEQNFEISLIWFKYNSNTDGIFPKRVR
jgi:hypothetical protein